MIMMGDGWKTDLLLVGTGISVCLLCILLLRGW